MRFTCRYHPKPQQTITFFIFSHKNKFNTNKTYATTFKKMWFPPQSQTISPFSADASICLVYCSHLPHRRWLFPLLMVKVLKYNHFILYVGPFPLRLDGFFFLFSLRSVNISKWSMLALGQWNCTIYLLL